MPLVSGAPPTSGAKGLPPPASPWHMAHFSLKIFAPCAGVPLPGGRPLPSGATLMSHAAMSRSEIGLPSPGEWDVRGAWAVAAQAPSASVKTRTSERLGVDMLHLPVAVNAPARDAV